VLPLGLCFAVLRALQGGSMLSVAASLFGGTVIAGFVSFVLLHLSRAHAVPTAPPTTARPTLTAEDDARDEARLDAELRDND
jgi:hypothetical protein